MGMNISKPQLLIIYLVSSSGLVPEPLRINIYNPVSIFKSQVLFLETWVMNWSCDLLKSCVPAFAWWLSSPTRSGSNPSFKLQGCSDTLTLGRLLSPVQVFIAFSPTTYVHFVRSILSMEWWCTYSLYQSLLLHRSWYCHCSSLQLSHMVLHT